MRPLICVKACLAIALAMVGCSSDDPPPAGAGGAGTGAAGSGGAGGDPAGCRPETCPQPESECQYARCDDDACAFGNVHEGLACDGGACDGEGACVAHCDNGVRDFSETDVDCGGSCAPCALGLGCVVEGDCATGFCIDGVCCDTACDGVCEGCDVDAGTCTPHPQGTDPDDDCAPLTCNGEGACE